MKNAHKYLLMLMALAAGSMVAIGCNQSTESESLAESGVTNMSEATVVAKTDGGCCGKCGTKQAAAAKAEGCCGKCAAESDTSKTENVCCGKCAGEASAASKNAAKTITCENGCNACAEGDSENCKCGDTDAAAAAEGESEKATEKSELHVNTMPEDRDIFHYLLEHHEKITRTVTELDNGVETVTESTDPVITAKIQEHVASMSKRVEDGRPLRMWDQLYREVFKHADKIEMQIENTEHGISVTETSDDEYVVKLIQQHAKVVSGFAKRGFEEARENHKPPNK